MVSPEDLFLFSGKLWDDARLGATMGKRAPHKTEREREIYTYVYIIYIYTYSYVYMYHIHVYTLSKPTGERLLTFWASSCGPHDTGFYLSKPTGELHDLWASLPGHYEKLCYCLFLGGWGTEMRIFTGSLTNRVTDLFNVSLFLSLTLSLCLRVCIHAGLVQLVHVRMQSALQACSCVRIYKCILICHRHVHICRRESKVM